MSWRSQAPERPLVLLLGWLGCSERHLHKYSTLWQDLGAAHVVTHRPTILQTAVPSVGDRALLALMQDVTQRYSTLCSLRGGAPPVLVHAMRCGLRRVWDGERESPGIVCPSSLACAACAPARPLKTSPTPLRRALPRHPPPPSAATRDSWHTAALCTWYPCSSSSPPPRGSSSSSRAMQGAGAPR